MKFALTATVLALLLGAVDAARIEIIVSTGPGLIDTGSVTHIGNDNKETDLGYFRDGCKSRTSQGIKQVCIDGTKNRSHVIYNSGLKRCFKRTKFWTEQCGGDEGCYKGVCVKCNYFIHEQTDCTW